MSKQTSPKLSPHPSPRGVFMVSNLMGGLVLGICIIFIFVLLIQNEAGVEARDIKLSIKPGKNGHPSEETRIIPSGVKEIYLQFYLEKRGTAGIPLEFRWYAGDQLIYLSSNVYRKGYVTSYFEFDPNKPDGLQAGNYHVEVWFRNAMILSEAFVVE